MMRLASIDPGITGAVVLLDTEDPTRISFYDMPVMAARGGKHEIDGYALAALLAGACRVVVESVGPMPGQGVASMFNFGKGLGVILGVCAGLGKPVALVSPRQWKAHHGLIGSDKDYARTLAIRLFPHYAKELSRKKDIGRADALLLALYGASNAKA